MTGYRTKGENLQPWVVPFHYHHIEKPAPEDIRAGLWIPGEHAQQLVDYAVHLVHYALVEDMENAVKPTGIQPVPTFATRLEIAPDYTALHLRPEQLLASSSRLRRQVEDDFEVWVSTS